MTRRIPITDIRFVTATERDRASGLHGYIRLNLGDFVIDGITLRSSSDRRWCLSFPCRTDKRGDRHPVVRPIDDETRREVERLVLAALGLAGTRP